MRKLVARAAAIIAAFMLVMLVWSSPAVTQGVNTAIPKATEAYAKFPAEPTELLDKITFINRYANNAITYTSDIDQYGFTDFWVTAPDSAKGDCEDYVLTKLFMLGEAGYPTVSRARIRAVQVTKKEGDIIGHAILELRLPNGSIAFLDNGHRDLMTRAELVERGYKFFDW